MGPGNIISGPPKSIIQPNPISDFGQLPISVRQRVYFFLGFPVDNTVTLFTDKFKKHETAINLRERYNIDFNRSGSLSQPWNYERNERHKRFTPQVCVPLMQVSKAISKELYELLYSNSLFMVNLQGRGISYTRNLTSRALSFVTHLVINYHGQLNSHNISLFGTTSHHEALIAAITQITPLVPNVQYFGLNFWTPSLHHIFPTIDQNPKNMADLALPGVEVLSTFLLATMNKLVHQHRSIKTFALLRDGAGRGILDWDRKEENVKKGISRDLRNAVGKALV